VIDSVVETRRRLNIYSIGCIVGYSRENLFHREIKRLSIYMGCPIMRNTAVYISYTYTAKFATQTYGPLHHPPFFFKNFDPIHRVQALPAEPIYKSKIHSSTVYININSQARLWMISLGLIS
jgi:hypothetical protein